MPGRPLEGPLGRTVRDVTERNPSKRGLSGDGSVRLPRPFADFGAALARYPAAFRALIDAHGGATAGDWRMLAWECRDRAEEYCAEPGLDYEPVRRKRRAEHHGRATSTTTGAGRVQLDHDDPLKAAAAAVYLPALTGTEVSSSGRCRCPVPDHEDVHPSAKCYGTGWVCFACGAKGDIIALGAALYGVEARGRGYWEIRRRLLAELGLREAS